LREFSDLSDSVLCRKKRTFEEGFQVLDGTEIPRKRSETKRPETKRVGRKHPWDKTPGTKFLGTNRPETKRPSVIFKMTCFTFYYYYIKKSVEPGGKSAKNTFLL
jgi:hypothetical protein